MQGFVSLRLFANALAHSVFWGRRGLRPVGSRHAWAFGKPLRQRLARIAPRRTKGADVSYFAGRGRTKNGFGTFMGVGAG